MKPIFATDAPAAIGPYRHAIVHNGLVFCSGQLPIDPVSMQLSGDSIEDQTRLVMKNMQAVLSAAGSGLDRIIKTTIFLSDLKHFDSVNKVYEAMLGGHKPARSTIEAAGLPKGALIEIECIASVSHT